MATTVTVQSQHQTDKPGDENTVGTDGVMSYRVEVTFWGSKANIQTDYAALLTALAAGVSTSATVRWWRNS